MADIRSTYQLLKDRKKLIDDALQESGSQMNPPTAKPPTDPTDLLSDAAIDAEVKKRKAAQPKKGWLW